MKLTLGDARKVPRRVTPLEGGHTKSRSPPSSRKKRRAVGLLKDVKKLLTTITVLAVLIFAISTLGLAAEDSATTTVSWTVNAQQSLYISSNGPSSSAKAESIYNIPEPSQGDLKRGYIKETNAVELVARSNIDWEVQVKAEDGYMGTSDSGSYRKPVSDLSVRGQESFGFQPVSTSPTIIAEGGPGEFKFGVDYKVNYDEDYKKGNYKVNLVYTITVA